MPAIELTITAGSPEPHGVTICGDGINVAVFSAHATAIMLCLFSEDDREIARLALPERTGDIFHGHVAGVAPGMRYGLRAHGPFEPRAGHRFNAHKLLLDPHAAEIDRPFVLHPSMFAYRPGGPDADLSFDDTDSAPFMPKGIVCAPRELLRPRPLAPWNRTVLYELHVRGFTKLHGEVPSALRGTFAGLAHEAPLAHLKTLGITSAELMPCAAWLDERHLPPLGLTNYWGYNPVAFGAPDPRLSPGGWDEVRASVATLAEAGIETLIDVVLNHSGEGDELGPTVCLRGLDNASYYRLDPANPRHYANDAGCGNTLALERPAPLRLAMDSLRRFAEQGGVHGFRFDLATTLGRRADGFDPEHPLLLAIQSDPVLGRLKLIAEPWDIGMGGYQLGQFPPGWGEWNDRYRDTARRFWRGDHGMLGEMATRLAGSADVFAHRNRPLSRGVNFITAHDGFTLADLVSHEAKHNLANGEHNRDGTDANHSWNHGTEGESDNPEIQSTRKRDVRALLATLLLSRGTPMLAMGDELGRSQGGNNNAYAQDNATSWLDWSTADAGLIAHTRDLIRARLGHAALWRDKPLTGHPADDSGQPDARWLRADGTDMTSQDWAEAGNQLLIVQLREGHDQALIIMNGGAEPVVVTLPEPEPDHVWTVMDGAMMDGPAMAGDEAECPERTVWLFTLTRRPDKRRKAGIDPAILSRLASVAGIAPDWWDVGGQRHEVTPDVQIALLKAMRLPVSSSTDARAHLGAFSAEQVRRALPVTHVVRTGATWTLDLAGQDAKRRMLRLDDGNGAIHEIAIQPGEGQPVHGTAPDGRPLHRQRVILPAMAAGRYHAVLDGHDDEPCHLVVAPQRCWEPPALAERRFGLAAHLYTLRRDGDQGIGDFTTLAAFGAAAAAAGAVTVGLNPMHALFDTDRERASPYHPSDRRFLDPIYIDVTTGFFTALPGVRTALASHETLFRRRSEQAQVDYPAIWRAKRHILRLAFEAFEASDNADLSDMRNQFSQFVQAGGQDLERFAAFEVISARQDGRNWQRWPASLRAAEPEALRKALAGHAPDVRLVQFQQWLAERDLARASDKAGLHLGFYRDLAVGSAPDGAEAWACQDIFATGVSIGAPPDPFSVEGQVWSLPAPDPAAIRRDGYRSQSTLLKANMRQAGALRIDHAMGLSRLFWVPDGARASEGAYVGYHLQEQLGVLAMESQTARCIIIGEDLGTVPHGFRQAMAEAAVLSYKVLALEREGEHFVPPSSYPHLAAACAGTHDLPTLAGWWEGHDIAEREAMGLLTADAAAHARQERARDKDRLLDGMRQAGLEPDPADRFEPALNALIHRYLSDAPSALMLVQADDLVAETTRINLPGTDRERPNWRRKLRLSALETLASPLARLILHAIRHRSTT